MYLHTYLTTRYDETVHHPTGETAFDKQYDKLICQLVANNMKKCSVMFYVATEQPV